MRTNQSPSMRGAIGLAVAMTLATSGMGLASPAATASAASAPRPGGTLTALEATSFAGSWNTLDPATDTSSSANAPLLNAIYGGLFLQGPGGGIVDDLASGYKISSNGLTVDIFLRRGVIFQDGTPFNASAVAYNIQRDLNPKLGCICAANFPVAKVTTPNSHTVALTLKTRFAPIISAFFSEPPDWIISPTALKKEGEKKFAVSPVGAGPFEVVSDKASSELKLRRNPKYWQAGHPYLDNLTFTSVGTDASAVDALQAGQGQTYENISPVLVSSSAAKQLNVCTPPATGLVYVQLNTTRAPFNNILAREALSYATDPRPILQKLYQGKGAVTESPTGPGGLFHQQNVPSYRSYDLAEAKALVKQLGGLKVTLTTVTSDLFDQTEVALEGQWNAAGIKTTLQQTNLTTLVKELGDNSWETNLGNMGAYDPALIPGINFHFSSASGPGSGVKDPELDRLLADASATASPSRRAALYKQVYALIASKSYAVFLFSAPGALMTEKDVRGVSCTDLLGSIQWANVWLAK